MRLPLQTEWVAKPDTGVSRHYFKSSDTHVLTNLEPVINGPSVLLPNGSSVQATSKGTISINNQLNLEAQQTYIFPGFKNASLIALISYVTMDVMLHLTKINFTFLKTHR